MARNAQIEARLDRQALAARASHRERLAARVTSPGAAAAAFEEALLAFADEPTPQNAGRYLAASERLAAVGREAGTRGSSGHGDEAATLAAAA